MTKYILISGKKQSGKDYTAKIIKEILEQRGYAVVVTSFATPIKKFVHDVFGIPLEDMETEEGKQKLTYLRWSDIDIEIQTDFNKDDDEYITVREMLQAIGTNVIRKRFYDQIWAEAPFRKVHTVYKETLVDYENGDWDYVPCEEVADFVIIPDCRFPNEVEAGLKHNAALVRITTPSWGDVPLDNHISEVALDDYGWDSSEKLDNRTVGPERIQRYVRDILLPKSEYGV